MRKIYHHICGACPVRISRHHKHTLQDVAKFGIAPLTAIERNVPGGSFIVPAALTAVNPVLGAAYEGDKNWSQTGNIGSAATAAGTSYVAGQLGSALGDYAGNALNLGTIGSNLGSTANVENSISSTLGNAGIGMDTANSIGGNIANKTIGSLGGQAAGNAYAQNLSAPTPAAQGPATFTPTRADELAEPTSLSAFGNQTGDQLASNIATQGVYGSGEGPQEQSYFNNLINRRLVDQSGNVGDISSVTPIEQSYLSKLGLGGYSNSKDLLEAMSKWSPT